jgi:thiol-disulfide isomerase/thioredoxin
MRYKLFFHAAGLGALSIVMAGCDSEATKTSSIDAPSDSVSASAATTNGAAAGDITSAAPATSAAVKLLPTDKAGLEATIAKHKGEVVLVDFWATWCGPCKEQFPHTVELSHKYRDQGLAVISVSCDTNDEQQAAEAFLQRVGADFENFLSTAGFDSLEVFDIQALPHYRIYDRQGTLVKSSGADPEEVLSPEEIEEIVKQELVKKAS